MPSNVTVPVTSALCFGSRPITASDVTLLPQPDSPTSPSVLPRASEMSTPSTATVRRPRSPWNTTRRFSIASSGGGHYFGSAASAAAMPASIFARSNSPDGFFEFGRNFAKCTQRSRLTCSSRSSSGSGSA